MADRLPTPTSDEDSQNFVDSQVPGFNNCPIPSSSAVSLCRGAYYSDCQAPFQVG
jgi:hypothetical protein